MLTTTQSFEVHASAIKENTKPDSFGYLIVNVTYMIADAKDTINNYNSTFVFGPDSRDVMLKEAETMLTSGLYFPDRIDSVREALKKRPEFPISYYYPELACTSPANDKGLSLPLSPEMPDSTSRFLPIPSASLIDFIVREITIGRLSRLQGGKIDYITYMDAGSFEIHKATTGECKSPGNESAKAAKAAFKAKYQRQEPKTKPINIWFSAGIGVMKDEKGLERKDILNNIIDLINEKELDRKTKGQDSLFYIRSKNPANSSDKDSDLRTNYMSSVGDFRRLAIMQEIDALCIVYPLLRLIDPLDMNLIMQAATYHIPIHIISNWLSYIELPQLEKRSPHVYENLNIAYLKAAESTKVYLHPDAFDFVMRVKKK